MHCYMYKLKLTQTVTALFSLLSIVMGLTQSLHIGKNNQLVANPLIDNSDLYNALYR